MEFKVNFQTDKNGETTLNVLKKLGQGKTDVLHVKDSNSAKEYAIKTYLKDAVSSARYTREKDIISTLNHPNIIKYYPVESHDGGSDVIITEFVPNGDFFSLTTKGGLRHEVHIRTYFHQLIEGLEYMHSRRIAHLDLKLENLLIGRDFLLKIIDFDQSYSIDEEQINPTGTNCYRCPEIQNKNCTDPFAADVYSAGILLYTFKAKKFPFIEIQENGKTKIVSYDLFMENNQEFWREKSERKDKKEGLNFSEDFKQLINGMLEKDPAKRMTIQDIKASAWFNKPILAREKIAEHMGRVCQEIASKENSNTTPRTPPRSTFDAIVTFLSSPKSSKARDNLGFETKLWGCGRFSKSRKGSREPKNELKIDKFEERSTQDMETPKKSGLGSIWGLISPKSSSKTLSKGKESPRNIDFSTQVMETSQLKKIASLKAWSFGPPKASAAPTRILESSNQKVTVKKPIWTETKENKTKIRQMDVVASNSRRPVRLNHEIKV